MSFLPSFIDDPDGVYICRYLGTVDATALRATGRDVRGDVDSYRWCDIKSLVWGYLEPQWRACFPRAQGYLSVYVRGVIYPEGEWWPL